MLSVKGKLHTLSLSIQSGREGVKRRKVRVAQNGVLTFFKPLRQKRDPLCYESCPARDGSVTLDKNLSFCSSHHIFKMGRVLS